MGNGRKNIGSVTIEAKNASVQQVLVASLNGKPYSFSISDQMVTIFPIPSVININGRVTDDNLKPMPGVSITVKGTQSGTATDEKGEFAIFSIDPKAVLIFSYVGFQELQEKLNSRNSALLCDSPR